jgi:ubiquinone/menaquinone biosynthesis C-methylase UbiE
MTDNLKVIDDRTRWDNIHKKTFYPANRESLYAEEKEKLFPRNSLVVEIGGGTGEDALYFLKQGHRLIFFEISPEALRVTKDRVKESNLSANIVFRQLDYGLERLPVKDSSVDVVYSRISLQYFDREHTIRIFRDIYRILKPGGQAFLSFKSPEDKEEMNYLENVGTLYEPNVYIENGMIRSRFTKEQLEDMIKSAGIKEFKVTPIVENLEGRRVDHKQSIFINDVYILKSV